MTTRHELLTGCRHVKGLNEVLSAFDTDCNATQRGADCHFTAADARVRQKHLCPMNAQENNHEPARVITNTS